MSNRSIIFIAFIIFITFGTLGTCETPIDPTHSIDTYMQITADNYNGPECWLLSDPTPIGDELVVEIYAKVDTSAEDWHNQIKKAISLVWSQYSENEKVMLKIYNDTTGLEKNQPTYDELVSIWQSKPFSIITESQPTITWYPNGGGMYSEQESEIWHPEF